MICNSRFSSVVVVIISMLLTVGLGCHKPAAIDPATSQSAPKPVGAANARAAKAVEPKAKPVEQAVAVAPVDEPAGVPQVELVPVILGIAPASGSPGQRIRVTGENLRQAKEVQVAVGYVGKKADFRVVSDVELEVTAPEFYRVEPSFGAEIVVIGAGGVSVTCPTTEDVIRDSVRFRKSECLHILDGGSVEDARCVTVIESGGIVTRVYGAAWTFVRDGGVLGKADYAGTVFYEKGARLGHSITHPGKEDWNRTVIAAVQVPRIHVAEGVGPFTYELPTDLRAGAISAHSPAIKELKPTKVHPGTIVTVTGRGFLGTTNVWLAGDYGTFKPTGFRVVSDEELKLEVPHMDRCKFSVTLLTPRGATLALAKEVIMHPGGPEPMPKNKPQNFGPLMWVRDGEVADRGGGAYMMFVEDGGTVAGASARAHFVKRGGTVRTSSVAWYFTEDGARVPDKASPHHKVDTITLSVVKEPLDLFPQ